MEIKGINEMVEMGFEEIFMIMCEKTFGWNIEHEIQLLTAQIACFEFFLLQHPDFVKYEHIPQIEAIWNDLKMKRDMLLKDSTKKRMPNSPSLDS